MNVMLAYPNRAGDASYSGGAWSANLPVSYLATRQQAQVARTTSAATANTWFYAAGGASMDAGILALCNHNLTTSGQVRWRGFANDPVPRVTADFTAGTTSSGWTFARSTVANYYTSAGVIVQAAINEPRPSYDSGGAYRGLLFEAGTTNYALQSRGIDSQLVWTKVSIGGSGTTDGPDGVAGSTPVMYGTLASNQIYQACAALNSSTCTFSVWIKRISGSGTVGLSVDSGTTVSTVNPTTSWARYQVSGTPSSCVPWIRFNTAGDAFAVDFAQCELGYTATTPIVTGAGTANRQYETLVYTPGATEFALASGHLALTMVPLAHNVVSQALFAYLKDAGNNNGINLWSPIGASGNNSKFDVTASSSPQASITSTGAWTIGSTVRAVGSWTTNDVGYNVSGTAGTPDTTAAAPANYASEIGIKSQSHNTGAWVLQRLELGASAWSASDLNSKATTGEIAAGYDSGLIDAWPAGWAAGTTAEQRAGIRGLSIHKPGAVQSYRWWRCDLSDSANPAGYLQLGRVFIGTAWSPSRNMSWGASLGYTERASVVETFAGSEYFAERPQPRIAKLSIKWMNEAEAMGGMLELQRQQGNTKEVLFMWDPADTLQLPRRSWLGRLKALVPLGMPLVNTMQTDIEIKELL